MNDIRPCLLNCRNFSPHTECQTAKNMNECPRRIIGTEVPSCPSCAGLEDIELPPCACRKHHLISQSKETTEEDWEKEFEWETGRFACQDCCPDILHFIKSLKSRWQSEAREEQRKEDAEIVSEAIFRERYQYTQRDLENIAEKILNTL